MTVQLNKNEMSLKEIYFEKKSHFYYSFSINKSINSARIKSYYCDFISCDEINLRKMKNYKNRIKHLSLIPIKSYSKIEQQISQFTLSNSENKVFLPNYFNLPIVLIKFDKFTYESTLEKKLYKKNKNKNKIYNEFIVYDRSINYHFLLCIFQQLISVINYLHIKEKLYFGELDLKNIFLSKINPNNPYDFYMIKLINYYKDYKKKFNDDSNKFITYDNASEDFSFENDIMKMGKIFCEFILNPNFDISFINYFKNRKEIFESFEFFGIDSIKKIFLNTKFPSELISSMINPIINARIKIEKVEVEFNKFRLNFLNDKKNKTSMVYFIEN